MPVHSLLALSMTSPEAALQEGIPRILIGCVVAKPANALAGHSCKHITMPGAWSEEVQEPVFATRRQWLQPLLQLRSRFVFVWVRSWGRSLIAWFNLGARSISCFEALGESRQRWIPTRDERKRARLQGKQQGISDRTRMSEGTNERASKQANTQTCT